VGYQPGRRRVAERCVEGELSPDEVTPEALHAEMALADFPPPDLCIRTGGDARISNFLLWDFAYTELYFTPVLWPDFGELEFARALADYGRRERRFGGRGEPDGIVAGGEPWMLRQRVVTALLMAGLFLAGVNFLPLPVLAAAFALIVALGAWEWAPLAGLRLPPCVRLYSLLVLLLAAALYVYAGFGGDDQPRADPARARLCGSVVVLCPAVGEIVPGQRRILAPSRPARAHGTARSAAGLVRRRLPAAYREQRGAAVVVLVLVVAAADIGAYFTGRAFGRHALSPSVSPSKTWEGFWGGVFCAGVLAAGSGRCCRDASIISALPPRSAWPLPRPLPPCSAISP
jgi:phosphatidate cytidylyltransferase